MAKNVESAHHQRVVVVTGGRGRIGGALATALENRGYTVVAIDRVSIPGPQPRKRAAHRPPQGEVVHLRADLASEAQTRRAFRTVLDRYKRIDAAVLAAGAFVFGPFL